MYELIKKIEKVNSMVKNNKEIIVVAEEKEDKNKQKENLKSVATIEEIEQFTYGKTFKVLAHSKEDGKIEMLTKFADEDFYIKDFQTGKFYMSVSEDVGDRVKKITILKCSESASEFYSYINKNGKNDLIRAAIVDNKNDKKLVVTNSEAHKLTNNELVNYAKKEKLGEMLEDILSANMDNIKNMISNMDYTEEDIKKEANDSYERYRLREGEFYTEIQNDDDRDQSIDEYLEKYKVTLNGQEMDEEDASIEIGNALNAIDEEEVARPAMWRYCYELNDSIKMQIARTQGIDISKNNLYDVKEY